MNWELKILVASLFATSASFGPFFSLFMQDKGFDALQIGTMISFSRTIMLISTPAACAYADRRGVHRGLLAVLALTAGFVMLGFPFVERGDFIGVGAIFALYSMCAGSKLAICDTIVLHGCKGKADKYPLQRLWGSVAWGAVAMVIGLFLKYYHRDRISAGLAATYEIVPLIHAFFQLCFAGVLMAFIPPTTSSSNPSMTSSSTGVAGATAAVAMPPNSTATASSQVIGREESSSSETPTEGLVNRGVCSVDVTGPLSSFTTSSSGLSSTVVVPTTRGLSAAAASSSSMTPTPALAPSFPAATHPTFTTVLKSYVKLAKDRRIFFPVVLGVSILSLSEVAMNNFLFPYLRRALHAPPELFSYVLAIHAVSEVVAFTSGSYFVNLIGPQRMLVMSSLAFCAKAAWYAVLEDPWSLLYVEMLHGVCFAMMWTAAVAHVSKVSDSFHAMIAATELLSAHHQDAASADNHNSTSLAASSSTISSKADEPLPGAGGQVKAESCVRAASMAMTTLWFFANGLPNILGGVLSGYVVQHAETQEIALFRLVAVMAVAVAALFWLYGVMGCFKSALGGPTAR